MNNILRVIYSFCILAVAVACFSGCSAGKQGLLSITPQQYFYSAKEKLEAVDERNFEIRDLDEIIRVLENAEKDAKNAEIMDKSRLYLTLLNSLKAAKQYRENQLKGQYIANRPEPFYALDLKTVQETLRTAKKWLRSCEAAFKTTSLAPDLLYVKGIYYTQKMLTQISDERRESFQIAVESFRKCLGIAPDYKADFRLFGRIQGPREVRLRLIECLALAGELPDAYSLVSEYTFSPANPRLDYPWMNMKGLVLAMMGFQKEAMELLGKFKIVVPQDYPRVDEALWILEGVFDRLKEETEEERYTMEAKIVASILKKLKGPFSKEKYTTASHIFPKWMPGDKTFFSALKAFVDGNFPEAKKQIEPILTKGLLSSSNQLFAKVISIENEIYSGNQVTDEMLESLLSISMESRIPPLLRERIGYLLARYVCGEDKNFKSGRLESEGQTFIKSITQKPWALSLRYEKDPPKKVSRPQKKRDPEKEPEKPKAKNPEEMGGLRAEIYANRPDDWVVSANLSIISLPEMSLLGKGKIVAREEEGKGWLFKSEEIDQMKRGSRYLMVLEYSNSDSDKNVQGIIFQP